MPRTIPVFLASVLAVAALLVGPGAAAAVVTESSGPAGPSSTEPADPSERVTWAISPGTDGQPDGRVSLRYELDPGGNAVDEVVVRNYADRETTFALYAGDGITTPEGLFDLAQGDIPAVDAGSWIELDSTTVTVPAGGQVAVPFRLSVPADATPGDHPAGIVAAVRTAGQDGDGAAVSVERRVGVRVHLRVTGDLGPALAVENLGTGFAGSWSLLSGGTVVVDFEVANTGNVRLAATGSIELSAPLGLWSRSAPLTGIAEILPGQRVPVSVELDGVPPLFMISTAVLIESAPVAQDEPLPLASNRADDRAAALPWLWILLVALVALLVVNIVVSRGRWRRRLGAAVAQAKAEALAEAGGAAAAGADDAPGAQPEPAGVGGRGGSRRAGRHR